MPPSTLSATPLPFTSVEIQDTLRLSLTFRAHPHRVAHMRHITGAVLRQDDIGGDAAATVQLLVSEIVTNAVVHGRAERIRFSLAYDGRGTVLIEVDDHSPAPVAARLPDPDEESGRGMFLVSELAGAWGRRGSCTWCTVATREVAAG
ncbi:ATP-binding protein [Streptomyces sp. NPDC056987]|uniref:ATP-binding protein n=1 Tax=Streptomyces sp. NPDC056987 TaxID=3345988 RepID=UPI003629675A